MFSFFFTFIVQTLDWTLPYDQYKGQLVDHAALMLTVTGRVSETKQLLATKFSFCLRTPDIIITVSPRGTPISSLHTFLLTQFVVLASL